ncbi:MAG: D-2-hydroxyacid dehydrogenase [Caldilineaceae bacterium]|nr:D-2-hydroxyacid dehydrogenase [Caldilineaceae bacterium]
MDELFAKRQTGIAHRQAWTPDELTEAIADAHVLVVSGFWRNELLELAPKLRFIQSIGAGYDQFPLDELRSRGIRLASAAGVNRNAVSEHALALMLAFTRQLNSGFANQQQRIWRGMIGDYNRREDELAGKTMLLVGLGGIGGRIAKLAKAFDMHVVAVKRNPATAGGPADEIFATDQLTTLLPRADFLVLACPLTPETEKLIGAKELAAMKPTAYLINVARGGVVDEAALIHALQEQSIAGAGLDVTIQEPLPADSPLWTMDNVILTPHTAGETRRYEENVIDILVENIGRLAEGENPLQNQIV